MVAFDVWGSDFKGWIFNYRIPHQEVARIALCAQHSIRAKDGYLTRGSAVVGLRKIEVAARQVEESRRELVAFVRDNQSDPGPEDRSLLAQAIESKKRSLRRLIFAFCRTYENNGLPDVLAGGLEPLCSALDSDAQAMRFSQVRSYIEREVLSRLSADEPAGNGRVPRNATCDRLLIVGCSERKNAFSAEVPAIDLYDGPFFRTLRKARAEGVLDRRTEVFVLSAKYGLISSRAKIETYDQRMTAITAIEQRPRNERLLRLVAAERGYNEVMLALGSDYVSALGDVGNVFGPHAVVHWANGRIGEKLSEVKRWLLR
jgi:hypothetical protein